MNRTAAAECFAGWRCDRRPANRMLEKLKDCEEPVRRRELYRKYDDESKALHDPVLEFLLRTGQARSLEDGRVEPVQQPPRAST